MRYSDNRNMVAETQQPSVTFQREPIGALWGEIEPLLVEHYREIAAYPDIPLVVDKPRYEAAEANGMLRCYTVRVGGTLVGYAWFFVSMHMHYATSKQAVQDVVFVSPSHRRGRLGLRLLRYAHGMLAAENVEVGHHHVKVKHPALRVLLEYDGFEVTEWVLSKRFNVERN